MSDPEATEMESADRAGVLPGHQRDAVPVLADADQDRRVSNNYAAIVALLRSAAATICGGVLELDEMAMLLTVDRRRLGPGDRSRVRERLEALVQPVPDRADEGKAPNRLRYSREDVEQALEQVAAENPFHPVREYLSGLIWDGVVRIGQLPCLLGAETTTLNQTLLRKFLISAVARVMRPGCKVDNVLVLVGPQGSGKSTFFSELAGPDWFTDSVIDIHNKDAFLVLRQAWILEWSELESMQRARDADAVKAFITSREDKYRPPYGRSLVSVPRTCVIAGTTNNAEFLTDPSGNRRYWPISVGTTIDVAAVRACRDQLWAEALAAFSNGEVWWLGPEEERELAQVHQHHEQMDAWHEHVERHLAEHHPPVDAAWDTFIEDHFRVLPGVSRTVENLFAGQPAPTAEVRAYVARVLQRCVAPVTAGHLLSGPIDKPIGAHSKADEMRVAKILKRLGWKKGFEAGVRIWSRGP